MSNQLLSVQKLSLTLNEESIVQNLFFEIDQGETLALVGESGSGKTLSALSILKLLPNNIQLNQKTRLLFSGEDLRQLAEYRMRLIRGRRISMIFQEPMLALNPVLTVGQQLIEVLRIHTNLKHPAMHDEAKRLLLEVGLDQDRDLLVAYPHQLSGGMRQRVMIAMALATRPDLLIADEPTTALDVTIQAQILDLLASLKKRYGLAMLFISHDLAVVKKVADRVAVLYRGHLLELASADSFFKSVQHPYSELLFAALPDMNRREYLLPNIENTLATADPKLCCFLDRCPRRQMICEERAPEWVGDQSQRYLCHLPELKEQKTVQKKVHLKQSFSSQTLIRFDNLVKQYTKKKKFLKQDPTFRTSHFLRRILLKVGSKCSFITYKLRFFADFCLILHQKLAWCERSEDNIFLALDHISGFIQAGETLAVVGESGSGKSTLAKALIGVLALDEGEIDYVHLERSDIQMIFQDPHSAMNPKWRVREILSEGLKNREGTNDDALVELLEKVGLKKTCLDQYPHAFSGGQKQRLVIARALAAKPKLIICDEPTSALDVSVQAQLLNLLKQLQIETGMSYLLISHNIGVVSYLADRIVVMKSGRIVEAGDILQVLTQPQHHYTQQLLNSVPRVCD